MLCCVRGNEEKEWDIGHPGGWEDEKIFRPENYFKYAVKIKAKSRKAGRLIDMRAPVRLRPMPLARKDEGA